jgi:hypothetical protein
VEALIIDTRDAVIAPPASEEVADTSRRGYGGGGVRGEWRVHGGLEWSQSIDVSSRGGRQAVSTHTLVTTDRG